LAGRAFGYALPMTSHLEPFRPEDLAHFDAAKMAKSTLFHSDRVLVGLNAFEPGQEHRLHTHADMDKVYFVLAGTGLFLTEEGDRPMREGDMLAAPEGVPHGIRNDSDGRLLVMAILAPAP